MSARKRPAAKKAVAKKAPASGKGSDAILRRLAMELPETVEADHFGMPSFRVAKKIFATARLAEPKAMVLLPAELQEAMCAAHPRLISKVPGYWGERGATFIATDKIETKLLADLLASAWARVAPKALRERAAS